MKDTRLKVSEDLVVPAIFDYVYVDQNHYIHFFSDVLEQLPLATIGPLRFARQPGPIRINT